ncbi:MAG: putative triple gene block protein 2 [Hainan sediment alphaflexivirus 1]|nr:MAG: putative triple gene block protein 2 [Hainan sediment alphaflexivirus 1]
MPLTPPRDYTPVLLIAVIAGGLGLLTHLVTRSTLPRVGDNIHSLPHGGTYRDGTKAIRYGGPHGPAQPVQQIHVFLLVVGLVAAIWISSWGHARRHTCTVCVSR